MSHKPENPSQKPPGKRHWHPGFSSGFGCFLPIPGRVMWGSWGRGRREARTPDGRGPRVHWSPAAGGAWHCGTSAFCWLRLRLSLPKHWHTIMADTDTTSTLTRMSYAVCSVLGVFIMPLSGRDRGQPGQPKRSFIQHVAEALNSTGARSA